MDVFFYGLFMDPARLKERGVEGTSFRRAWALDRQLVIADRATLVRQKGKRTPGVTAQIPKPALDRLYAAADLAGYYADGLVVELEDGTTSRTSSWVIDTGPRDGTVNPAYIQKLRDARLIYGFPIDDLVS